MLAFPGTTLPSTDNLFSSVLDEFMGASESRAPKADIREGDNTYYIDVELPGFNKENINVDVEGDYVTVSAKRDISEDNMLRSERFHGSYKRSFRLMEDVDREGVSASFKDGVLTVSLPLTSEKKERQKKIPIF